MASAEERPFRQRVQAWTRKNAWWIVPTLGVLYVLVWWLVPLLLYRHTGTDRATKLRAITDTRTALIGGLIGLGALLTFWLNSRAHRISAETLRVTEQGQITDRYSKAIEQLGSDKQDVRLGGIYALERIANDSPPDRATIEEVLTAFVRGHSPLAGLGEPSRDDLHRPLRYGAPDVQAALTVLGRRKPPIGKIAELDLSETDLSGAHLQDADLRRANLEHSRLHRADLVYAQLPEALLRDARLQEADLRWAELQDALLPRAQLQRANLAGVDLKGADLTDVNLEGAHLPYGRLQHVDLQNGQLQGADLTGAKLQGANLTGANLTGAKLEGAQCTASTIWPDGFDWRAAGVELLKD